MDRVMAVVTREKKYSERFCDYVNRSGLLTLIAVPFDSLERCKDYSLNHDVELLITEVDTGKTFSVKNPDKSEAKIKAKKRIYLDTSPVSSMVFKEGGGGYEGEDIILKKYQSAEDLLNGIVKNSKGSNFLKMGASSGINVDITGVFNPMTSGLGTAFALSLARESGSKGRTLFISFSEFTPVLSILEEDAKEGISEAMYQLKQGKLSAEKINSLIIQTEWFDFLSPVSDPDDVRMIQGDDCIGLINEILSKTNYAYLIVELDRFSGQADAVMDICDNIAITEETSRLSQERAKKFIEYLEGRRNAEWMKKVSCITLDEGNLNRNDLSFFDGIFYGNSGNSAREFMEKKEDDRLEFIY